jgi:AcrR family transcriptional regulator
MPDQQNFPTSLTLKGKAMRDRIVESAANLIFQSGARETSLDQVREAAGASKSQIYHYFLDKDALIHAVIDLQAQRILASEQATLSRVNTLADLKRWIEQVIQMGELYGRIGGCPLGSLANELAPYKDNQRDALMRHLESWRTEIEQTLRRIAVNEGFGPEFDALGLSYTFLAAIQGGLMFAKLTQSAEMLSRSLRQIVDILRCK